MIMNRVVLLACVWILSGCATGTTIMTSRESSRERPVIACEKVLVYFQYPPFADEVAIITESAGGKGQKATDKAIRKLKERAGKIGANGIVVQDTQQHRGVIVYGAWIIPTDELTISARAIYVP